MKTQDRSDRDNSDRQRHNQLQPIEKLLKNSSDSAALLLFEAQLAQSGLLARLEESGVIPKLRNPNPYDLESDTAQHDNWWKCNQEQQSDYLKRVSAREKALRQLYVGMQLR